MSLATFQEFEAYADSIRDANLHCMLPRMERPAWSIRQFHVHSVHVQYGSEGGGNIAEGAARRDGWALYLQCGGRWGQVNGIRLEPGALMVIVPGSEFCLASQDPHDWMSVFLPTKLLFKNDQERQASQKRFPSCRVIHPGALVVNRLRHAIDQFSAAVAAEPAILIEPAFTSAACELLVGSARTLIITKEISRKNTTGRPIFSRSDLVSLSKTVIEADPQRSPTVRDLVQASRVSERTLRCAFLEYFGVSPRQYIDLRRLHQSRKLLCHGDPNEVTVTLVAAKLGYWDFGRFAGKYRQLFGELPSETLKRKRH